MNEILRLCLRMTLAVFSLYILIKITARGVAVLGRRGKRTDGGCADRIAEDREMIPARCREKAHENNVPGVSDVQTAALPEVRGAGKWEAFF